MKTKIHFKFNHKSTRLVEFVANNEEDIKNYLKVVYSIDLIYWDKEENEAALTLKDDTATYYAEMKFIRYI